MRTCRASRATSFICRWKPARSRSTPRLALTLPEGLQSSHTEVGLARFHRIFTLSQELDTEKVTAELSNGVLRLSIPKAEHAKPRRISVNAA